MRESDLALLNCLPYGLLGKQFRSARSIARKNRLEVQDVLVALGRLEEQGQVRLCKSRLGRLFVCYTDLGRSNAIRRIVGKAYDRARDRVGS